MLAEMDKFCFLYCQPSHHSAQAPEVGNLVFILVMFLGECMNLYSY